MTPDTPSAASSPTRPAASAQDLDTLVGRLVRPWSSIGFPNIAAFAGYFCRKLGLRAIPRDPVRLLPLLGVRLEPGLLPRDVKAVWCRTGAEYRIGYSRHLAGRVSLALWHELFEILASHPLFPSRLSSRERERLATLFAVHVMMPEEQVRRQAAELGHPLRMNKSRVLASRFGVSVAAMRCRLRELGLEHPADAARRAIFRGMKE